MLSLVVTTRLGSGRSSCRSPQKVERGKEEARNERDGEEEEEKEQEEEEEEGEGERGAGEKRAPKSSAIFSRDRAVGRPTKGISILNPIGGYAWPFHLFATGPKLVPLESSSSLLDDTSRRTSTDDSL